MFTMMGDAGAAVAVTGTVFRTRAIGYGFVVGAHRRVIYTNVVRLMFYTPLRWGFDDLQQRRCSYHVEDRERTQSRNHHPSSNPYTIG